RRSKHSQKNRTTCLSTRASFQTYPYPRTLYLKGTGSTSRSLPHRLSPKRIETDSCKTWKRNIRDMVSPNIKAMARQSIRTPSASWDLVPSIECLFLSFESFAADFHSCVMSLNKT